jgi:hypothetical protein
MTSKIRFVLTALVALVATAILMALAFPAKRISFVQEVQAKEIVALYPALVPICSCESNGRPDLKPTHYEKDGTTTLSGRLTPEDRGACQISAYYWSETAEKLGYDIESEEGNIRMANYLYDRYGSGPWRASSKCHGK